MFKCKDERKHGRNQEVLVKRLVPGGKKGNKKRKRGSETIKKANWLTPTLEEFENLEMTP